MAYKRLFAISCVVAFIGFIGATNSSPFIPSGDLQRPVQAEGACSPRVHAYTIVTPQFTANTLLSARHMHRINSCSSNEQDDTAL